jgi:RNA polymerase sigma factor (TIGR02999 family)
MPVPSEHSPERPPVDQALSAALYEQLRVIARHKLAGERPGHTLQATALVHEAYLRLVSSGNAPAEGSAAFYWAAAEAMRRILIDHSRSKGAMKRGGRRDREAWTNALSGVADLAQAENPEEFEALDGAILRLQETDARAGEVVRLRFYAGLNLEEVAAALGISARTAKREWEYARAWLLRELGTGTKADAR